MKLIEREPLLQRLEERLRAVADDGGHVVLIGGEAGIGKTSLLNALNARRAKASTWWGACDALETPLPLAPLYDIARDSEVAFRALLREGGDRMSLFEAVFAQLQRSDTATLFVIEDAHWADEATLDLLRFLGRRIERTRCLLAISYRDDEVGAAHPLRRLIGDLRAPHVTRIDMPRLSPDAVAALARSALRAPEGIFELTRGNPFFVDEMLRYGEGSVPRGVQDLVLARFARLPSTSQRIVRLVCIVPSQIERSVVETLLGIDTAALEICLDSGLLVASASTLSFRHELARVAVESSLSASMTQSLHADLIGVLEKQDPDDASLARLVHHATRAADANAVLRYAPEAARQASRRGAHRQAAAHWTSAIEHASSLTDAQRAEMRERQAYEFYLTDRMGEACAAHESALSLWRGCGNALKAGDTLRWLSRVSWYDGNTVAADRYAVEAIDTLQALPQSRELAMAYSNRAQLDVLSGRQEQAVHWGNKALALAAELGDREIEIHALNNVGTARANVGERAGLEQVQRSLDLALAGGFEEHVARAFTNLAYAIALTRDGASAMDCLDRGIAYCEARDLDSWTRYMAAWRSACNLEMGNWTLAEDEARKLLTLDSLATISKITALTVLGRLHARRGDDAEASHLLGQAWRLAVPTNNFLRVGSVAAARAEAAWLRGDLAAAVPDTMAVWNSILDTRYFAPIVAEIAVWLVRSGALAAMPDSVTGPFVMQSQGHWQAAAEGWRELRRPYEQACALAEGDIAAQREAHATFERLGARCDAERVRKQLLAAGERGLPRGQRASTQANPHELTMRELEVLRMLCAGLKNAQIAERLSRSVRTVDHHLAAVFAKLGVATRTEAMAAAIAAGLDAEK